MRRNLSVVLAAIALAVLSSMGTARAAELVYVSGPGGPFVGYTVPVMVAAKGDTITYVNADAFPHDVIARHTGPETDWCLAAGIKDKLPGVQGCPLFWSSLIGVAQQTPVLGLENIEPGAIYSFFCSIHANMEGTLVVLPY
jgi:plastocyanin